MRCNLKKHIDMAGNCNSCGSYTPSEQCNSCQSGGSFITPIPDNKKLPSQEPVSKRKNVVKTKVKVSSIGKPDICYDCVEPESTQECEDTAPNYLETGSVICEQLSGVNTGFSLTQLRDANPCSETFNQTIFRRQSSVFCIPQVTPVLTIFDITC